MPARFISASRSALAITDQSPVGTLPMKVPQLA